MSLYVVATPIGNPAEISKQALQILSEAEILIGEEAKVARAILKSIGLPARDVEELNEHSEKDDIERLAELCVKANVALISDCGTPGFCDPGAELVKLCRKKNIPVKSVPGSSSLMAFLSVCGHRLDQFLFAGFLPRDKSDRERELKNLAKETKAVILMDTPYRLKQMLEDLQRNFAKHTCVLGLNLGTDQEQILEGNPAQIVQRNTQEKAEFLVLLLPLKK